MPPAICPNCGATVPLRAKACPACGSDEQTGWSEEAATSGLDLAEENFDYNSFFQEEFGERSSPKPRGISWFWWAAAVALLAAFLLWYVR